MVVDAFVLNVWLYVLAARKPRYAGGRPPQRIKPFCLGSMSPTAVKALYLLIWLGVVAVVIYLVTVAGYSFWLGVAFAYAIFFLVNGSLAYRVRARSLRAQGEQPPPFLAYLFFPRPLSFRENVRIPRPVRVLLGIMLILGGLMFFGIDVLLVVNFSKVAHPVGAVAVLLAVLALGIFITFVGWRLLVVKGEDSLFKRSSPNQVNADAA